MKFLFPKTILLSHLSNLFIPYAEDIFKMHRPTINTAIQIAREKCCVTNKQFFKFTRTQKVVNKGSSFTTSITLITARSSREMETKRSIWIKARLLCNSARTSQRWRSIGRNILIF